MDSVSPVFAEKDVQFEKVIALDQPEYAPIITLPIDFHLKNPDTGEVLVKPNHARAVRFRFTEEERKALADGCDLVITQIVFGGPFTPINLQLCNPGQSPEF